MTSSILNTMGVTQMFEINATGSGFLKKIKQVLQNSISSGKRKKTHTQVIGRVLTYCV
jgi:hypothetical protein